MTLTLDSAIRQLDTLAEQWEQSAETHRLYAPVAFAHATGMVDGIRLAQGTLMNPEVLAAADGYRIEVEQ